MKEFKVLISGNYNAFNEGWNGAGVYACSGNYISETFNTPWYIGSTKDFRNRILEEHIPVLKGNRHDNNPLQFSWNRHNENEGFIWFLLESCEPIKEILLQTEQKYLDLYRPFADEFGGFNISHCAESPMRGRQHSKETKRKLSERNIGKPSPLKGRILPESVRQKISQSKTGKKYPHKKRTQQTNINKAKHYIFVNPNGDIVKIFNMKKFCRDNQLNDGAMIQVAKGRYESHKGWKLFRLTDE